MTLSGASSGNGDYLYGRNAHGDISTLLNSSSAVTASYGYHPYGTIDDRISHGDTDNPQYTNNPLNPMRFNDKRFDSGSGSIDMGARRYDPTAARFLSVDFYRGALDDLDLATDPLTKNRYGYGGGNPIGFVEEDGHVPSPITGGGFAGTDFSGFTAGEIDEILKLGCYASVFCSRLLAINKAAHGDPLALIEILPARKILLGIRAARAAGEGVDVAYDTTKAAKALRKIQNLHKPRAGLTKKDLEAAKIEYETKVPFRGKHLEEVINAQNSLRGSLRELQNRIDYIVNYKQMTPSLRLELSLLRRTKRRVEFELRRSEKYVPRGAKVPKY
jgi:RHS repeat-associated protein